MGQDVESYFQEVLAAVEQSAEEGSRGEGGALRGRLQQLYGEIVGETDAGKRRRRRRCRSRSFFIEAQNLEHVVCTHEEFVIYLGEVQ